MTICEPPRAPGVGGRGDSGQGWVARCPPICNIVSLQRTFVTSLLASNVRWPPGSRDVPCIPPFTPLPHRPCPLPPRPPPAPDSEPKVSFRHLGAQSASVSGAGGGRARGRLPPPADAWGCGTGPMAGAPVARGWGLAAVSVCNIVSLQRTCVTALLARNGR